MQLLTCLVLVSPSVDCKKSMCKIWKFSKNMWMIIHEYACMECSWRDLNPHIWMKHQCFSLSYRSGGVECGLDVFWWRQLRRSRWHICMQKDSLKLQSLMGFVFPFVGRSRSFWQEVGGPSWWGHLDQLFGRLLQLDASQHQCFWVEDFYRPYETWQPTIPQYSKNRPILHQRNFHSHKTTLALLRSFLCRISFNHVSNDDGSGLN